MLGHKQLFWSQTHSVFESLIFNNFLFLKDKSYNFSMQRCSFENDVKIIALQNSSCLQEEITNFGCGKSHYYENIWIW